MPKLEKTVADLERRLRLANSTLNNVPMGGTRRKENLKKEKNIQGDEENQGFIEEEKQNLIADMDFEVIFRIFLKKSAVFSLF